MAATGLSLIALQSGCHADPPLLFVRAPACSASCSSPSSPSWRAPSIPHWTSTGFRWRPAIMRCCGAALEEQTGRSALEQVSSRIFA